MDSDWDLTPTEWGMMSRYNKCAKQLYPYSSKTCESWATKAFRAWRVDGVPPETLRDQQSPGLLNLLYKRPPKQ